jgi:hypothetical protein
MKDYEVGDLVLLKRVAEDIKGPGYINGVYIVVATELEEGRDSNITVDRQCYYSSGYLVDDVIYLCDVGEYRNITLENLSR